MEKASGKVLKIEFKNGMKFTVPAEVIAQHRTDYYAEKEGFEKGSEDYVGEFEFSMEDDELNDWMVNNMNWSEVSPKARMVIEREPEETYEQMWSEVKVEVQEEA